MMNIEPRMIFTICVGLVFTNIAFAEPGAAKSDGEVGVSEERLATSGMGREITIKRLHRVGSPEDGPAWVVVAGVDPRHGGSTAVAEGLAAALAKGDSAALSRGDLYVVARLNPDGIEGDRENVQPKRETPRKPARRGLLDADRDGRFNEDPPADLDGDGLVLMMRVKDPAGDSGLTAEWVAEAGDPRVMRRADGAKGERAVYALLPESRDADGDGLFGEDGFDGVEVDRNFPYHWQEFHDDAGRVALSEPESRGVAEWLLGHPNIVGVLVYAPADNLVNVPPGGKMDETGEAPATNHVLDADRGVFEEVGAKFKEITRQKEAPTRDNEGTLQGWAYAQLGVWSFSTPLWVRPDQMKGEEKQEEKKEEAKDRSKEEPAKADEGKKARTPPESPIPENLTPTTPTKPAKIDSEEGKWMSYSDALVERGKRGGFVDWKPFKHPQLGDVEIGGFEPGFRVDIPASDVARLADEQAKFVADLLDRTARLAVRRARAERLGEGVWRVSVAAVNEGKLPTRTAMGVKVHRLPPTRWTIGVDRKRIIAGARMAKADSVAAGGELKGSWTITGAEGERVKVKLQSPECGEQEVEVVLGGEGGDAPKKEGKP